MSRTPSHVERTVQAGHDASAVAAEVNGCCSAGDHDGAAERFGDLVGMWQRRALRLAVHYLRDAADADDAVQDAFVKLYGHMTSYRDDLPFDAWFTRILVNACLDRAKARTRARRWLLQPADDGAHLATLESVAADGPSPERRLLVAAKWQELADRRRARCRPGSATSSCSVTSTSRARTTSPRRSA